MKTSRTLKLLTRALMLSSFLVSVSSIHAQISGNSVALVPGLDTRLIDGAADPCVDFFQYACGNFSNLHPIPEGRASYSSEAMIADYTVNVVHTILESAAAGGDRRTANQQKVGDFYAACTAAETINQNGLKPLEPELSRIAALSSKDQLPELLAHYQLINDQAFFSFGEQRDFKDARKQNAAVDEGGLGLPDRDLYVRLGAGADKSRTEYVQHITNILKLIGEPDAKAAADAQEVMKLETALARVSMDRVSRRDPQYVYHLMPVSQITALAPAIDWDRFFKATNAPPISEVNVTNPEFFKGLSALIVSTDLDTIKTYLRWQLIHSTPGLVLPQPFDDEIFDFYAKKLARQPEQQPRWKRCVQATDQALGEVLGQLYVAQEFPDPRKQATVQMVHDIEAAMDQDLDTIDWMSPATKIRAKEKLHAIADRIGFPDHWRDYSKLIVVRGDAFGNFQRDIEFGSRRQLAEIGQPLDRSEWDLSPPTVNDHYNPSTNSLNFPAGILQPPLYDPKATDAENYGHIGAIMGHELTHGFDDQGRKFDANGNLDDWWTLQDAVKFTEKADCEVQEYGNFVAVENAKVNGKLTLGENIADSGGARLAYIAFLADAKRKTIDLSLKQDGYTPLQQFFLGYAQSWCGSSAPEQLRWQVKRDPHSPRQFRVNGVVQNMHEFGEAFGCKTGQPMVAADTCRVW
jgi:putative endopeptidase